MTYPMLSDYNATTDLGDLLLYANVVTGGAFAPLILVGFFLIVLIGSFFMQIRFSPGRERPEVSFAAASFTTFGLAVIMAGKTGLLSGWHIAVSIVFVIIAGIWLYISSD